LAQSERIKDISKKSVFCSFFWNVALALIFWYYCKCPMEIKPWTLLTSGHICEKELETKLGRLRDIQVLEVYLGPWWWYLRYGAKVRFKKNKLKLAVGPVADWIRASKEDNAMLILTDSQKVSLSIKPVTKAGNPAAIDGPPVWSLGCEDHLKLEVI